MGHAEHLTEAEGLLALGRWEQARLVLTDALAEQDTPEAHEELGRALWWLCHVRESLDHRERAHAGYLAQHRHVEAAMVALDIGVCQLSNLDNVFAARGWIARARRSADIAADEALEGWLWLLEAYTCGEPHRQRQLLEQTLERSRRLNNLDLELATLADLGLSLVVQGEVPSGLRHLDEAMAGTLSGEGERLDTVVWASCSMLTACSLIGDHRRAARWSSAADRFAQKYGCPFLQSRCRAHYGRVLVALGEWDRAEVELHQALAMSADCGLEPRVEALAGLAEIRLRRGAVDETAAMLSEVGDLPGAAVITAEVLAAQGHPDRAVAVLETRMAALDGREAEFPLLAGALVDAYLADGKLASARSVVETLCRVSASSHPQTTAITLRATGRVAAVTSDTEVAEQRLRAAAAAFERLDLPFEAARTRLELARSVAVANRALAVVEAQRALDRLERLGAVRETAEAAALLRTLGVATRPGPRRTGVLTRRELDVLEHLRRGHTNPEIAEQLFISRRTVGHHVSSILAKLNLRTRAEAAAFAAVHPPASHTEVNG